MRLNIVLLFSFICLTTAGLAQQAPDLNFDQKVTRCEKKWVVFPQKQGENRYAYGYIYVDISAGFTFDLKGFFTVDNNSHFIADTTTTKTAGYKYRLGANSVKVALLPASHFQEMHIQAEPSWVKIYSPPYTDTVAHNYRMGFNLNAAGDCTAALTYLLPIYKAKPDYPGLEFELAYAYNDLNQTDQAITILSAAMKREPKNPRYYRELGYAYMKKNDAPQAISYFKQGIEISTKNEDKSEMGYNMAMVYKSSGKLDEYNSWMTQVKAWAAPNSLIYQNLVKLGF